MSAAKQIVNNRREQRDARFSGEFSCKLMRTDDDSKLVSIRPIDVSRRGLGFLVREPLRSGMIFWLLLGQERFRVEVAYCNSHLGIDNLYRCGLFLREEHGDLADTCWRVGLLSDGNRPIG
jgi:hypothetical protein